MAPHCKVINKGLGFVSIGLREAGSIELRWLRRERLTRMGPFSCAGPLGTCGNNLPDFRREVAVRRGSPDPAACVEEVRGMGWSWRIGRIAGIDVYVHPTFLILLAWVGLAHYHGPSGPDGGTRRRGLHPGPVRDRGPSRAGPCADRSPLWHSHARHHAPAHRRASPAWSGFRRSPRRNCLVALAGPAVNVVLAVAIYLGLMLGGGLARSARCSRAAAASCSRCSGSMSRWWSSTWSRRFPMDGGRVFRALLAMRFDYVRATQTPRRDRPGDRACVFGLLGLFINPLLIFIALFVWLAGAQEAGMVIDALGPGRNPGHARHDHGLPRTSPRRSAWRRPWDMSWPVSSRISRSSRTDRLVGVLTRNDLAAALGRHGPETPSPTSCRRTS